MDFKQYLIFLIIPLMILVILGMINYGPSGFFEKIKDTVSSFVKVQANFGMKELQAEEVTLGGNQAAEVNSLRSTLEAMVRSEQKNCFSKFQGFGEDLGENDKSTTLTFIYDPAKETTHVQINNRLGQVYSQYDLQKMRPCVIAGETGEERIPNNFFAHFIEKGPLRKPYYKAVKEIQITYQAPWLGFNGNVLRVPELGEDIVNDEGNNFESGGFLFKGSNNEICFFPTNENINADEDGLENEYINDETEDNSLAQQWKRGLLTKCD